MDGTITIGTELDTDKFDRQISALEKKIDKEESKKIIIETKLQGQQQELENAIAKTDELADAYQRLKAVQETVASGNATPEQFTTMQDLQNTYGTLEQIGNSFDKSLSKQDAIQAKVEETKIKYEQVNSAVSEYKQKIEGIKMQKHVSDVENLKNGFSRVGSSIQDAVKKAGNLVIGIFAVRSAYLALRQASSYLASYDKQYAANLEYIKYALTQAIAPVLQWIVGLAAKLLGYINAIMQAWFGINIFSRASAKSFNKMKSSSAGVGKSVGGASKAAKELRKTLAGFDEMNVLNDQSNKSSGGGGGGGGGGVTAPSFDFADQGKVPDWLQWIIDHKDEILAIMAGVLSFLLLWKLGLDAIKALGIGIMIAGIVYAIEGLIAYLQDPSFENFGKVIQGIGIAIIGLGVAFLGLPAVIVGVVVLIVGTIIKYWDQIKGFLQGGIDWLMGLSDGIHQKFGDTIGTIYDLLVNNLQSVLNIFDAVFTTIKGVFDGIIMFVKGVFTGNWQMAWDGIKKIFSSVWTGIKGVFFNIINIIKNMFLSVMAVFIARINAIRASFTATWTAVKTGAKNAFNWLKSFVSGIIKSIGNMLKKLGSTAGKIISGAFKGIVNGVLGTIERVLNNPINAMNGLIGVINKIPGVNLGRLNTFHLPRMAVGGIVNVPNKGTLVGSAIAGESGREGVVPLTDSQAMETLGEAIGRYITVNANITNTMNGRVISRQLQQIRNEQNFAYNRS